MTDFFREARAKASSFLQERGGTPEADEDYFDTLEKATRLLIRPLEGDSGEVRDVSAGRITRDFTAIHITFQRPSGKLLCGNVGFTEEELYVPELVMERITRQAEELHREIKPHLYDLDKGICAKSNG